MVLDDGVQVIGIDEAHFFSDLYEFCTLMAGFGVMVLLVYLNGTFRHTPWNNVVPLMAEMEEDIMIQGPCYRCPYGIDTLASFTIRTRILDEEDTSGNDSSSSSETTTPVPAVSCVSNNKKANDQKPVIGDIGDDALYIPVCRQCRLDRDPYNAVSEK
jgi:thymidine kinase